MTATLPDRKINPAKRGDLFVFPAYSSCTYLHGPSERTVSYRLATVKSVSREGVIKGYRTAGDSFDSRNTPIDARLVPAIKIDTNAALQAYVARGDSVGRDFSTLEEASVFLRPFLKL